MNSEEIFDLKKWIARDLGDDIVPKFLKNDYVQQYTYVKDIWSYVFENVYEPKFAQLVKLNLSLDATAFTENPKSNRLINEYDELCKVADELMAKSNDQDETIDKLVAELTELDKSVDRNEIVKLSLDNLVMDSYLSEASMIVDNFNKSVKHMSSLDQLVLNDNNDVNMDYLEKDLAELENHIRCKIDGNGSQVRLDFQLSNANLTDLLGTLASNELKNLDKLIQPDTLKNRQDLVMYNLDINRSSDAKQFEDLLDLQKFEFIEKKCEIKRYKFETEECHKAYEQKNKEIKELLKDKNDKESITRYIQIFYNHQRIQANHSWLKQHINELMQEKAIYEREKLDLEEKLNLLNDLAIDLGKSENLLADLLSSNQKLLDKLKTLRSESNAHYCSFFEHFNRLNAIDFSLVDYIEKNYERLKGITQSHGSIMKAAKTTQCGHTSEIETILNYSSAKSKSFIFNQIENMIATILTSHNTDTNSAHHVIANGKHLEQDLQKCRDKETTSLFKYVNSINDCLIECKNRTNNIDRYLKLVDDWWMQPAPNLIHKLKGNKFTVNGKPYDFYYDRIKEAILRMTKETLILEKFNRR